MACADAFVLACLLPLAIAAIVSGLDDLALDLALAWNWARSRRAASSEIRLRPEPAPEKSIAVLVPLWREQAVIGKMLDRNLAAIRYRNYHLFAGAYPNDPETMEAVRDAEARYPNVHLAIVPHNGPTSKADCLNWIVQAMRAYEESSGQRFAVVVTHDAEDVIHPDGLRCINQLADEFDMVQVPVLPLATPWWNFTHGVYCDEFAEFQSKDVPLRTVLGGFLPSNGVGTGYTRRALDRLARQEHNQIFDPACLTEDYDCGLRLHHLGFRQIFVPLRFRQGAPLATREYFPQRFGQAVRQRTRWVTGICLQSWEKHGWRGSAARRYWFWRDRKGLLGNPLSLLGNLICLYGLFTLAYSRAAGTPWGLSAYQPGAWEQSALACALLLQLHRALVRTLCAARIYGAAFALTTPLRAVWSNWINGVATISAIYQYLRARLRRAPLPWLKTEHIYPEAVPASLVAPEPDFSFNPGAVRPEILRSLPWRFVRRCGVIPVEVKDGVLHLAAADPPAAGLLEELRRHSWLPVRVFVVPKQHHQEMMRRASPQQNPGQVKSGSWR